MPRFTESYPRFAALAPAGLLAWIAVAWAGCGKTEEIAEADPTSPPVEAVPARLGSLPLVERLSGTLRADNQVIIYPEFSGRIAEVLVDNGDNVTTGQPLARIDDTQIREQVRQAEAGYRIAQARLRQAEARLTEADAQSRRAQQLNQQNLVSDLEYETLSAQRASAAADVDLAQAELERAAATLAERTDLLDRAVVRAPVDGVIGGRRAEIGMQVSSNSALFTLGDLSQLHVAVNLTDTMVGYIALDQPVRILAGEVVGQDLVLAGTVTRISPFLDEVTRSTEAEIRLHASDPRLRPGMFLPVDILYGDSEQATLIPTSALFTDRNTGTESIYILDTEITDPAAIMAAPDQLSPPIGVQLQPVRIIARGQNEVAVANLDSNRWVVTLGQNLLSADGRSKVRARPVSLAHVLELQSLNREDLLTEVLEATGRNTAQANP
ncbi:MAG: efflux RND transporter periplasmic adaptor subunit [Synoicihabitans sp.]